MPLKRNMTFERPAPLQVPPPSVSRRLRAVLLNLGAGGLCLKTSVRLSPQAVLKVNLPLNKLPLAAPTLAQVLWVRKEPGLRRYRAGLRFIL